MKLTKRKALSPVVATIILTAAVITIGAIAWAYARSASTVMTQDYINSVTGEVQYYSERFTIERVFYNNITHQLHIIVYNYGKNEISATLYLEASYYSELEKKVVNIIFPSNYRLFPPENKSYLTILPGTFKDFIITYTFPTDTNILVKCISERGNKCDKYYST
ncbi:hypothetical protein JW865_09250 [Candidatus Bathyarchaeota archaeon]|nr:hypothetical protein [Candidatus Bathyarchaeota archaeon]